MTPSSVPRSAATQAREFREAFDTAFALPPPPPPPAMTALVLLRAGGERIAVKRTEMSGLVRTGDHIVSVPGSSPAFLGLAGLQGEILPVWRLAVLLGRNSASPAGCEAGWLVLADARAGVPCAFACESFEQMVFVPGDALSSASPCDTRPGLVQALAPWAGALVPVVDLPALQAEILRRHPPKPSSPP